MFLRDKEELGILDSLLPRNTLFLLDLFFAFAPLFSTLAENSLATYAQRHQSLIHSSSFALPFNKKFMSRSNSAINKINTIHLLYAAIDKTPQNFYNMKFNPAACMVLTISVVMHYASIQRSPLHQIQVSDIMVYDHSVEIVLWKRTHSISKKLRSIQQRLFHGLAQRSIRVTFFFQRQVAIASPFNAVSSNMNIVFSFSS
ncbi:hypothetical protein CU098_011866, partial [Rhizopus stolonifer]